MAYVAIPPTGVVGDITPIQQVRRDFDSGYDDGDEYTDTTSLTSSQYLFEKQFGRTYHSFAKDTRQYVLPNDEPERDRLDMQFWAIHEVMNSQYFFAPIGDSPQHILDIGTGTGMWAIDVGDLFPSASIRGTDLSPIQPSWVPPNVSFQLHDCLVTPWDFHKKYDLIHTQEINGFAVKDWEEFYHEAYLNLKPGGWVESHEIDLMVQSDDGSLPQNSAIVSWLTQWDEGAGGGFRISGEDLANAMRKVGFVDVTIRQFKVPIGPWMRDQLNAGILSLNAMCDHMDGWSSRVFRDGLGMTEDEMEAYIQPVLREWKNKHIHTYWPLYAVYGRRPLS